MIAITGATGHLGTLVVQQLAQKLPAGDIVALARRPESATQLAALGVAVRPGDYTQPDALAKSLSGVEKLLLISSNALGGRVPQHKAAIDAAKQAGVRHIIYTSILDAPTSPLLLAPEHLATEQYLREAGIPYTFLRNGWYTENYLAGIGAALAHGVLLGAAGGGRLATASRADYAAAAVAVLTGAGHENKAYELTGDTAFTLADLAGEISQQSGKQVVYRNLPEADYAATLQSFGLPEPVASGVADADAHAAQGALDARTHDLSQLIGRPTTPMAQSVAEALAQLPAQPTA